MLDENGQSDTEQPLTKDEERALFESIFREASGATETKQEFEKVQEAASTEETATEEQHEEAAEPEGKQAETEAAKAAEEKKQELIEKEKYEAALREKAEWEQKARSLDGREAARQRQIAQLERELEQARRQQQQVQAPIKEPKNDKLEALKVADPDLYELLIEREERLVKQAEERALRVVSERVDPLYRQQEENYAEYEKQRLKEMIPNVDEILQSDYYAWWYDSQPQELKRRANESADAAAFVIRKWYADMQTMYPQHFEQQSNGAQAPTQTNTNTDVTKLQEAREKRSNATGVQQKNTPTPKKESLSDEELFKQVFNQSIQKRR